MSDPLRLDLEKYGAARYRCGCFVTVPFSDAVAVLGLRVSSPVEEGKVARAKGNARYVARGQKYVCRMLIHTRDTNENCCFHMDYSCDDKAPSGTDDRFAVRLSAVSAGMDGIFGHCPSQERMAETYVAWDGAAIAVEAISVPAEWPNAVRIVGAKLVDPTGRANAIVQEFSGEKQTATAVVSIEGGNGLSPSQVSAGFRLSIGLAKAFRDGAWNEVEKLVSAYDKL